MSWIINVLPIVLMTAVVLLGCRKSADWADIPTVGAGVLYGVLMGVFGAAALGKLGTSLSPWYSQHPLDRMAYLIIMLIAEAAAVGVLVVDYCKNAEEFTLKQILLRLGLAGSVTLAMRMPLTEVLEFFEGIFDQLVA